MCTNQRRGAGRVHADAGGLQAKRVGQAAGSHARCAACKRCIRFVCISAHQEGLTKASFSTIAQKRAEYSASCPMVSIREADLFAHSRVCGDKALLKAGATTLPAGIMSVCIQPIKRSWLKLLSTHSVKKKPIISATCCPMVLNGEGSAVAGTFLPIPLFAETRLCLKQAQQSCSGRAIDLWQHKCRLQGGLTQRCSRQFRCRPPQLWRRRQRWYDHTRLQRAPPRTAQAASFAERPCAQPRACRRVAQQAGSTAIQTLSTPQVRLCLQ